MWVRVAYVSMVLDGNISDPEVCYDKTNILGSPKKQKNSRIANNHNTITRDTKI
jgi:hypothetical protein